MTILVLGEADSIWTMEYIQKVLLDQSASTNICIFTHGDKGKYSELYDRNSIAVFSYGELVNHKPRWCWYGQLKKFAKEKQREIGTIDLLHIQYLSIFNCLIFRSFSKMRMRRIVTMWGSDLLRANYLYLAIYKHIFRSVNTIHLLTKNMREFFVNKYGHKYDDKLEVFDFGCPMYESIDSIRTTNSATECKKHFGIDENKIAVAIGYNGNLEQQHIKMIEPLAKLDEEYRKKLQLIIHFGYGMRRDDYLQDVVTCINQANISYVVIDRFLDKEELSKLRLAIDIFLYGQTTDALAASLVEYLYAGAICVKGRWLNYPDLTNRGVEFIEFDSFDEISGIMRNIFENDIDSIKNRYAKNKKIVWEFNSWEVLLPIWVKLVSNS